MGTNPMLFQSSHNAVSCRIEVTGGNFEDETGELRRRVFQQLTIFLVAVGASRQNALGILADEFSGALIRCLRRLKSVETEPKDLQEQDPFEGCGDGGEEEGEGYWPAD